MFSGPRQLPYGKALRFLLNLGAGGAAIATLLGFAGFFFWLFELLDHPRPQYVLLLLPALFLGILTRTRWMWIWGIPILLNLAMLSPLFGRSLPFIPPSPTTPITDVTAARGGSLLQILHSNLDRDNRQLDQALTYLDQQAVDLMFLQEVTDASLAQLRTQLQHYQVIAAEPRENSHGSAILVPKLLDPNPAAEPQVAMESQSEESGQVRSEAQSSDRQSLQVIRTQLIHLPADSDRPLLSALIRWQGVETAVLSLHVIRPRNAGTSAFQTVEFEALAKWSMVQQQAQRQVIIIGDFNSTPWSGRFRNLLRLSRLRNSQSGFGLQPTWPAGLPPSLRIAIDHCLHSGAIATQHRELGPPIGSDHLPLKVGLEFIK